MATSDHHVDWSSATWRKSTRSSANGECVEVGTVARSVAVRDSKNPDGPKLLITQHDWTSFLRDIKLG